MLTWTEELSLCTIEAESEVILLIVLIIIDLGKSTPSFDSSMLSRGPYRKHQTHFNQREKEMEA